MTERVLVKDREGNQYSTIKEAAGFTLIREPYGPCQGSRVALSFSATDIAWLAAHLGDWVRTYDAANKRALQDLFVNGDAPAPQPQTATVRTTQPGA